MFFYHDKSKMINRINEDRTFEENKKYLQEYESKYIIDEMIGKESVNLAEKCGHLSFHSKGEERKFFIRKQEEYYKRGLESADFDMSIVSAIGLSMLLVKEKSVRNLDVALGLFQFLKENKKFPSHLKPLEQKALRMLGRVKMKKVSPRSVTMIPASLKELRKDFRLLVKKFKKEKNVDSLKKTLNEYYKFGVLFSGIFGKSDGYVGGHLCDVGNIMKKKITDLDSFSFETHGKIIDCNFISNQDWNNFEKVFGRSDKMFDAIKHYEPIFKLSFQEALKMRGKSGDFLFREEELREHCSKPRSGAWNSESRKADWRERFNNKRTA